MGGGDRAADGACGPARPVDAYPRGAPQLGVSSGLEGEQSADHAAHGIGGESPRCSAAAAHCGLPAGVPSAHPSTYTYDPNERVATPAPELAAGGSVLGCSCGAFFVALLSCSGEVLCAGANGHGQLGTGDTVPREGLAPAHLPWPAAAVSCGTLFCVALRRGGTALCSWGAGFKGQLGRSGPDALPAPVDWLPASDPVVLLAAGGSFVIMITARDAAYGFGSPLTPHVTLIPTLCDLGVRRLACGVGFAVVETSLGQLRLWTGPGFMLSYFHTAPGDCLTFPLRSLAAGRIAVVAADADGGLWCHWDGDGRLSRVPLPAGERAVRVAVCYCPGQDARVVVCLTVEGHLWDCRKGLLCRNIHVDHPQLPLGLLPAGGAMARRIVLVSDPSCGLRRCRLFLLSAARRRLLPGGQAMRTALVPFLVCGDFIFDDQEEVDME